MTPAHRVRALLAPLFAGSGVELHPAPATQITAFRNKAANRGVPQDVIDQLTEFYRVSDGVPCLDGFDFHPCGDELVFEWWDDGELWLAQRDFSLLRWTRGRFHLGDASNLNFSPGHSSPNLIDLLELAFREWYPPEPDRQERGAGLT